MTERLVVHLPGEPDAGNVIEQAVRAYHAAWHALVDACPGGAHGEGDGLVRARTGIPLAPFNGIWALSADVDPAAVLSAVDDLSGGRLPWNLQLRPGYPPELDGELAARGLVPTGQIPFMVLTDPGAADNARAGSPLTCRRTEVFVDADAVLDLLEAGLRLPSGSSRAILPLRMLFLPGATTWIASDDGRDVSTAMRMNHEGACGIFNVATTDADRGRGYGTVAAAHAVLDGFRAGAGCAYVQGTPLALPVYEKLGFTTVEHWQQWMPLEFASER